MYRSSWGGWDVGMEMEMELTRKKRIDDLWDWDKGGVVAEL